METKIVNNEISVDRLISLEKQNTILLQQVGALEADKKNLQKKLEDDQREVKIIKGTKKQSYPFNDYKFEIDSIETRNLGNVEELVSKKYKSSIDEKESLIRTLTNELEDKKSLYERQKKELENQYADYRVDTDLRYEKDIKKLKEELKKVKEDKTDEQEAEKRNKEIIDLKTRIKSLEKTVKNLTSINVFKRIFNAIIDKNARVEAQKELLKEEQIANEVKGTHRKNSFFSAFDIFGF
jgi:hypothetical protein